MGQAKNRGTFEQRKAIAIKRDEKKNEELRLARMAREQNFDASRKRERNNAAQLVAMMSALGAGAVMPYRI